MMLDVTPIQWLISSLPPGRNIAPPPDPATVTPPKVRQARHNKARSRDGSADDGLFFGHTDDAGALAQG